MPIYEYKCENGHLFEVIQKMTDEPVTECEECGAPVIRVLHSPAVHFKGSGFYNTDYGKKKTVPAGSGGEGENGSPSEGAGDSGKAPEPASGDSKSTDTKSGDSKAAAKSAD